MLWEPDRHEALGDVAWDADAARIGIRTIAAAAEDAYDPGTLFPVHPADGPAMPGVPWTSLYCAASGVALALNELARLGLATARRDWRGEAARFVDIYLATPAQLLTEAQRALVNSRAAHTLAATARRDPVDATIANWPPHIGLSRTGREKILVQWCHGAPGMILALSRLAACLDPPAVVELPGIGYF